MAGQPNTFGRGPLGVPTNSPIIDLGTSARVQNRPNLPIGTAAAPRDGTITTRLGGNREQATERFPQLKLGTRGRDVQRLQRLLNLRLDADEQLKVDGGFGPKTRNAVIEFQKEEKLKPDGLVGRDTWFSLISAGTQAASWKPSPPEQPTKAVATTTTTATRKTVDQWTLSERFEHVLEHAGPYLLPDVRAQFTALLTPVNLGIMVGSLVVWAAGHFFGVSEIVDAFLLGFGLFYLGRAAIDAARLLKSVIEITCSASTEKELEDAAKDLAEAIAIIGVVAFFALLAKVSRAIGEKLKAGTAAEESAAAEEASAATKSKSDSSASDSADKPSAADPPTASVVNQNVYRVDGRPPDTIFKEGFQPRGTSTDLKTYVNTNNASAFVSTSKTPAIADNPAFGKPGTYLYEVDGSQIKGIDVNQAYPDNPFANESEIAVVGGVPPQAIISAKPVLPGGGLGPAIPNPTYGGAP